MFFYNLFLYLLSPFILIRLIIYMIRNSISLEYLFTKLFGTKSIKHKQLWIHAASVGEMKIAIELSRELTKIGQTDILITSNTPTSKTLFDPNVFSKPLVVENIVFGSFTPKPKQITFSSILIAL